MLLVPPSAWATLSAYHCSLSLDLRPRHLLREHRPPPGYPIYGRDLPCYLSYSALFFFFLVLITSCACACVCLPPWVVSSGTARAGIVGSPPYAQWLVQLPTCITLHARLLNESMIERRLDQSFPRCMQSGRGRKPLLFAELCLHTVILRATLVDGFV